MSTTNCSSSDLNTGVAMFSGDNPLELPAPTAFHTAINYSSSQSIHQANARAIVIGSDIYYSPNCSLTPPLPTFPTGAQPVTYFRDPLQSTAEEFHHPQWWSLKFGYLPFLPTSPNLHCPPFHVLFSDPIGIGPRKKRRLRMNSNDALNWNRLEAELSLIFGSFQSRYSIPPMSPIVQTSLACQGPFEYPSQFNTAEKRCRGWFSIWMAMVSLGIAVAEISDCDSKSNVVPHWYRTLSCHMDEHRRIDEHTMSEIRQQLGQFDSTYPRAGVFIDLKSSQVQPTVDFFVRCGIPVWYPWGNAEESLALKNPSYWEKYIPAPDLVQRARSYTIPRPPTTTATSSNQDKPWERFFAERQRRTTGPAPSKKPTLKVYHWEEDSTGHWSRVQVVRRMQQETLDDYGKQQKKYDEHTNEWDCCTEMGELDAEERQAADWDNLDDEPIISSETPSTSSLPKTSGLPVHSPGVLSNDRLTAAAVSPSVSGVSSGAHHEMDCSAVQDNYTPDEHSPADILRLYFGFISPPPSVRLHLDTPSEQQINNLASGIGISVTLEAYHAFVATQVGKYAVHFFWSISQTPWVPPPNALFDLATGNPKNLRNCPRLKYLCQLPGSVYMFNFKGEFTVDWKIAVHSVSEVLFILRLDANLNDYEIAQELLNRGMPFATLLPVAGNTINPAPTVLRRLRLSGYCFAQADYVSYCLERDELLRNPRIARQALKRGGIIWRLATDRATFQNVLVGPTLVAILLRQCASFGSLINNTLWIDDVLDASETDALSGVYYVYTGMSSIH